MALETRKHRPVGATAPSAARKSGRKNGSASARRHSTVSQWGNSLGLRIPQEAAERLKLRAGARVSVEVHDQSILITPIRTPKKWTESELLEGVTPEMVGGEIDWGEPVGKEIW